VINQAVGEQRGALLFYLTAQPFQSSSVASHAAYQQTIEVPVISLDEFCAERGIARVDIIKRHLAS